MDALQKLQQERRLALEPSHYWHIPSTNASESWPDVGKLLLIVVNRDGISNPSIMLGDWRTLEAIVLAYDDVACATVRWAYAGDIAAQAQAAI